MIYVPFDSVFDVFQIEQVRNQKEKRAGRCEAKEQIPKEITIANDANDFLSYGQGF
jgi:hypothetical protein